MQSENRLQNMPISFFSMVMGLGGLTIAWEKASEFYDFSPAIFNTLLVQAIVAFVILAVLYLFKFINFRQSVVQEWGNPIKMNFVPAISICLLIFSIAFLPISSTATRMFWISGTAVHLVISIHVINSWLHHQNFEVHHLNPAWFIPAVGNVIVPLAGVPLGYVEISWFFFSIGIVFWLVLMVIVFNRIFFHQPMPEKLLPTMFILIAPPAVGFLAYFKLVGQIDWMAQVLYNFALFVTVLMISQLPRFVRLPFFLSWWAYSFPLAAMSIASMVMAQVLANPVYGYIGLGLLFGLSALVVLLLLKTFGAVLNHSICVPEH